MVEYPVNQLDDTGSIPSYPLHLLKVAECALRDVKIFIETEHYSHSVFGITGKYFFKVTLRDRIMGAAIFGAPAGMGVTKKYSPDGHPLVELRRFVLAQECPRNSESRCISVMLRMLRKKGVRRVLSYADPAHGHVGIIYRATGFTYLGTTCARKHVMWRGKKYPDRNIHQTNFPYHLELRTALKDGTATRVKIPGKHIYLKNLTGPSSTG